MKRSFIVPAGLFLVLFALGCTEQAGESVSKNVISTEEIGGKYNLTLINTEVTVGDRKGIMKMIRYEKDGEVIEPDVMLPDDVRPGLDWIRENTDDDAIVLSWWDWGHMIRAYAEREPVVDAPSREILVTTVSKYIGRSPEDVECDGCVDHELIEDVSLAFISDEPGVMRGVMAKYGASVLYVHESDRYKSFAFYVSADREPVESESAEFDGTIISAASHGKDVEGFELVYVDDVSRVYVINE